MDEIKDLLKLLLGLGAITACVWLYLKGMALLYERGPGVRRAPRLEIQRLFHGNTKDDKDQIWNRRRIRQEHTFGWFQSIGS